MYHCKISFSRLCQVFKIRKQHNLPNVELFLFPFELYEPNFMVWQANANFLNYMLQSNKYRTNFGSAHMLQFIVMIVLRFMISIFQ